MLIDQLAEILATGPLKVAQVILWKRDDERFELRHVDDRETPEARLTISESWREARSIAWNTADGEYRPLKGTSDLRPGWRLVLPSLEEVHLALDAFYPGALGLWSAHQRGVIRVEPLRATLDRQTGMYRYARNISDEGACEIIRDRCLATCLRTRLWDLTMPLNTLPEQTPGEIPFLCPEPCNLLVADARKVSKAEAANKL